MITKDMNLNINSEKSILNKLDDAADEAAKILLSSETGTG